MHDASSEQAYLATLPRFGNTSLPHHLSQDVVSGIGNPRLYANPLYGEPQTQEEEITQTDINSSHPFVLEIMPILMTKMEFALDILFI